MPRAEFDAAGFYRALDAVRGARGLNWKLVAERSGVSASTLTRLAQGRRPDVDSLAALVAWAGLSADDFVSAGSEAASGPEPIGQIASFLRRDPRLTDEGRDAMMQIIVAAYGRLST
ncbi:helix-turn-helix domain-containing protein [Phenylobacterium sp.]|uniref:helix-turn-helix domain-containing protein n=1 Tax=Phenylobacterium sp. TaxID=1871053 RepID=UPI0027301DAA|nr:helix-turn-helix domain-containing protein [Phenylobacterium sp.]MDP2214928.1 helix-turn-helix domain-containing protein [Phenylobacterium sp.]